MGQATDGADNVRIGNPGHNLDVGRTSSYIGILMIDDILPDLVWRIEVTWTISERSSDSSVEHAKYLKLSGNERHENHAKEMAGHMVARLRG